MARAFAPSGPDPEPSVPELRHGQHALPLDIDHVSRTTECMKASYDIPAPEPPKRIGDAITVFDGLRRTDHLRDFNRVEASNASQRIGDEAGLRLELTIVGEVLQLAASALFVKWTNGVDPVGPSIDETHQRPHSPPGLALFDSDAHAVSGYGSRHEDDPTVG